MRALAWMTKHLHPRATVASLPEPRGRLIVTERGVTGVEDALAGQAWEETVVVAEQEDTAPIVLLHRISAQLISMERRGAALRSATLVAGPDCSAQAGAARELVARSLLTHLLAAGSGELVLLTRSPSDELRDELLGLVGRLLPEVEGTSVTIRLQVQRAEREPPRKSGVYAVVERNPIAELSTGAAR